MSIHQKFVLKKLIDISKSYNQFSRSVMSDSLQPHELQHARLPCASLSPGVCSNSCALNRWCHPTISSTLLSLLLPSVFPSIRVFLMSWLSALGGQSTQCFFLIITTLYIFSCTLEAKGLMFLNSGAAEDSWESLGLQGDPTYPS